MNHRILSVLLLLIVAIGFSGVASAATMQKLVSPEIPAWDETIIDEPAWNETVPEVPMIPAVDEYSESVPYSDLYILQGPNEMQDWLDFIWASGNAGGWGTWQYFPETSHIEQQLVSEAYDEVVDPVIEEQQVRTVEYGYQDHYWHSDKAKQYDKAVKFAEQQVAVHGYNGYFITDHPCQGQGHWTVHFLDDVVIEEGYTIHHPAVYEDIKVVDEAAHYLVDGEYIINHPAVPAVPAVPAYVIEHPEVSHIVHHDAIPAVYETVEVADPVVPVEPVAPVEPVVNPVEPVEPVSPDTIPMQPTGGSVVPIALAILLVLAGLGIAASRRNK